MSVKHTIVRLGLETLYFSGAHMLLRPLIGSVGAILMLHHVRPARRDRFQPNRQLEVTPEFLARYVVDEMARWAPAVRASGAGEE